MPVDSREGVSIVVLMGRSGIVIAAVDICTGGLFTFVYPTGAFVLWTTSI